MITKEEQRSREYIGKEKIITMVKIDSGMGLSFKIAKKKF